MASADKKVNKITQIVRLKQVMQRWKNMSLKRRSVLSYSDPDTSSESGANRRTPSGSLAVYVGAERRRFVIPTRFLNLPVFVSLLNKAEEEFGFQSNGGLVLPSEVGFFREMLKLLERDEQRFGGLGLDEFLKVLSDVGLDSCKDTTNSCHVLKPLLQNN
ncbi:protein SMALL AUXIN UP-REGULATED RNA 51-like [Cornus florida]|uniref:protein SMALL AUXIN UP-REGULATED RNA 51-like n=1 Tax=Cornus florida TaxID=4283 RepID=UPI0028971934|nr:protein SMALL AUXIN UP-REGULATED RNA 51-like [Cornus florida]